MRQSVRQRKRQSVRQRERKGGGKAESEVGKGLSIYRRLEAGITAGVTAAAQTQQHSRREHA